MPVEHAALTHDFTTPLGPTLSKDGTIEVDGETVDFTHVLHDLKAAEIKPQPSRDAAVPTQNVVNHSDDSTPEDDAEQPSVDSVEKPEPEVLKPADGVIVPAEKGKAAVPLEPRQPSNPAEQPREMVRPAANSKVDVAALVRAALPLAPRSGQRVYFSAPDDVAQPVKQADQTTEKAKVATPQAPHIPQTTRQDMPINSTPRPAPAAQSLPQHAQAAFIAQPSPRPSPTKLPLVAAAPAQALAAQKVEVQTGIKVPHDDKRLRIDTAAVHSPPPVKSPPVGVKTAPKLSEQPVIPSVRTYEQPVGMIVEEAEQTVGPGRAAEHIGTANGPSVVSAPTPQLMRQIAPQLAVVLKSQADGTTEIRLDPKELGRVTINLVTTDGVIAMAVQAERPETADMMRRHIELLAQEFRDMGYDNLSFSFGSQSEQAEHEDADAELTATDEGIVTDGPSQNDLQIARSAGLDLRL
jgi:flagellar hook-length control protein FliK